ncbi:MAG: ABC transporter permease [Bacteroides sp.]|nr:ABC transporter permease [Bacteroides sp.]
MIKVYFKQACTLMKQHRLFTGIYILGTGLSIALVMTLFIIFYVKFAPIYPEYNRNRTLTIKAMLRTAKDNSGNWSLNSGVSYYMVSELLKEFPHMEALGATMMDYWSENTLSRPDGESFVLKGVNYTNAGFWQAFTFDFIQGIPYTPEQEEGRIPVAVISAALSQRLFATTASTGRKFLLNGREFTVCGVVKDVSNATPATAGNLWVPLSHDALTLFSKSTGDLVGNIQVYLVAPTAADKGALREEVINMLATYNSQIEEYCFDMYNQPDDYWLGTFREASYDCGQLEPWDVLKKYIFILLAFLIIPALNLSGMISSRMDSRLSEVGVRKAYGASNGNLVTQVLWENLLLTCIGGVLGLLLSYLIVLNSSSWILTLFDSWISSPGQDYAITFEMLFNPVIFCSALLFCIVLNLGSALIPTIWALRKSIISSIHSKL